MTQPDWSWTDNPDLLALIDTTVTSVLHEDSGMEHGDLYSDLSIWMATHPHKWSEEVPFSHIRSDVRHRARDFQHRAKGKYQRESPTGSSEDIYINTHREEPFYG